MQNELKQLVDMAKGLLKEAETGRQFTMEYVVARLDDALDKYPHDPVLRSVAQVVNKQIKNGKLTTSQKEIYNTYNHFANLSHNSIVKEVIGDLIYPMDESIKTSTGNETAYSFRTNEADMDMRIEDNPYEGIFDGGKGMIVAYDQKLATSGKHVLAEELTNMGVPATEIRVVGGNDRAVMYDAVFTNKLGTSHVAIPVEFYNNKATPPSMFYAKSKFVDLTAENLNQYIVEMASTTGNIRTGTSIVANSLNDAAPIVIDKVEMSSTLKDILSYEDAVINASTQFSPELVKAASAVCARELRDMGFNTQVSLAESMDNCIVCRATLDSSVGKTEIRMPVEIINDRPQIPELFYNEASKDKVYDFTKANLVQYLTAAKVEDGQIMRYSNDFFEMTYNQLKDEIIAGIANKDYIRAEQAINRIEDKFGPEYHRAALADYAKFLSLTAGEKVEAPKHTCRLLITKGSIEPRCGHYNVPISRVATDERGNCELVDRKAKYENLAESTGAVIRTNKIVLT